MKKQLIVLLLLSKSKSNRAIDVGNRDDASEDIKDDYLVVELLRMTKHHLAQTILMQNIFDQHLEEGFACP